MEVVASTDFTPCLSVKEEKTRFSFFNNLSKESPLHGDQ
jgi:hypothetical protein